MGYGSNPDLLLWEREKNRKKKRGKQLSFLFQENETMAKDKAHYPTQEENGITFAHCFTSDWS